MIVSASRRTDIPAFYSDWFMERVREGYADVRNPMNARQTRRVALDRESVDCFVFWSKDPSPMLAKLDELEGYAYYFQYTLNGYGGDVEPRVPGIGAQIDTFLRLADRLGDKRVLWRYDPILLTPIYTPEYCVDMFGRIARILKGSTRRVTISFVDRYRNINKKLDALGVYEPDSEKTALIRRALASIASENNMEICACCESEKLSEYGIAKASCVDGKLITEISGRAVRPARARSQRPLCGCAESADIGEYGTCMHGCAYCYARSK